MSNIRIAILYICTGKYSIFWKEFFESSETYLLNAPQYEKHYFVFTDSDLLKYETHPRVHKIFQHQLPWPQITLLRFNIFKKALPKLQMMDYIYFFNANMEIVGFVGEDLLPHHGKTLVMVQHPGFFNKDKTLFTYERNPKSHACITPEEGTHYFMGGLNGGTRESYTAMIDELGSRVDKDLDLNIIALWHDESHLNRYAIEHSEKIQILDPSYGYPEGWALPFDPKIIIRDKNKYGGHRFLRNDKITLKRILQKARTWLS